MRIKLDSTSYMSNMLQAHGNHKALFYKSPKQTFDVVALQAQTHDNKVFSLDKNSIKKKRLKKRLHINQEKYIANISPLSSRRGSCSSYGSQSNEKI